MAQHDYFTAEIRLLRDADASIIVCAGELDLLSVSTLRAAVDRVDTHRLILDFEEITFLDSTGISALVVARRRFDGPRQFALVCHAPAPCRTLSLMQLGDVLGMVDTLDEALELLS